MIRTKIPEQVMSHDRDFDLDRVFFDLNLRGNNKPEEALWTCDNQKDLSDVGWIEWNLCNYGYRPDGSYLRECLYKITPKDKEFKVSWI